MTATHYTSKSSGFGMATMSSGMVMSLEVKSLGWPMTKIGMTLLIGAMYNDKCIRGDIMIY